MKTVKVLRTDFITKLSSIKDDNVSIADVVINRQKLLQALKLQTQAGADVLTLTYGKVSWGDEVKDETCIQFNCDHTTMRFLNRPKFPGNNHHYTPKITPLNFAYSIFDPKTGIPIDPQELLNALNFVTPCIASEKSRPVLNCVLFDCQEDYMKLVTADGFRLALDRVNAKGITPGQILIDQLDILKLITFLKSVKPYGKGKNKTYPEVYMSCQEDRIVFANYDQFIELAKQQGQFPAYDILIPQTGTKIEFLASDLLQAVKAVAGTSRDGSGIVRFQFTKGIESSGKITLTSKSEEMGESSVDCDAMVDEDTKIALNGKYIIDFLKLCKDAKLEANVRGTTYPILLKVSDVKLQVIMPMFVQW